MEITDKSISILIVIILLIYVACNYYYMSPKSINTTLYGLKFRMVNREDVVPITISINGTYRPSKDGGIAFEGTIDVEDQRFDFTKMTLIINKDRMAGLKNSDTVLHAYFGDKLEKIMIKIFEPNESGVYSFSSADGWMISAPSKDWNEAVQLANELLPKNQRFANTF
ncbi:hypothetical protein [Lutispora thermophila]|uniref:Uncharacterized protein n=1 Tax=Lutispora thermophila DSM 19022 TaxID=1122184 RepID=A0A1M6DPQ7_9FIRM|nr:hypothetical protein [Lutispora thermophila]SHI75160.1 hypothetical protein SAMN02745176_01219 [Lutispora thermophila DSM 19022]